MADVLHLRTAMMLAGISAFFAFAIGTPTLAESKADVLELYLSSSEAFASGVSGAQTCVWSLFNDERGYRSNLEYDSKIHSLAGVPASYMSAFRTRSKTCRSSLDNAEGRRLQVSIAYTETRLNTDQFCTVYWNADGTLRRNCNSSQWEQACRERIGDAVASYHQALFDVDEKCRGRKR